MIITRDNKEINNLSSLTPWSVLQFVLVSPCLHSTWKFVIVYPIRLIETSELARIEPILNFHLASFSGVCVCVSCSSARNRIKKGFMDLRTMEVKHWRKKLGSSSRWPQRMEENFKLPFRCSESCVTFLFYFCHLFFSVFNPVRKRIQITFLLTPGQLENYNFFRGILFTTLGNYEGMPIFYIY